MAWFRRSGIARADLAALQEWSAVRDGIEAFVEPRTTVSLPTLVLVAGDGEFIRRQISSSKDAVSFARSRAIPIYDATRVGLPQRMRDYAIGVSRSAPKVELRWSPSERDAIQIIADAAGAAMPSADVSRDELRALLRTARATAHPDRNNGQRSAWDALEDAAKRLGLN